MKNEMFTDLPRRIEEGFGQTLAHYYDMKTFPGGSRKAFRKWKMKC